MIEGIPRYGMMRGIPKREYSFEPMLRSLILSMCILTFPHVVNVKITLNNELKTLKTLKYNQDLIFLCVLYLYLTFYVIIFTLPHLFFHFLTLPKYLGEMIIPRQFYISSSEDVSKVYAKLLYPMIVTIYPIYFVYSFTILHISNINNILIPYFIIYFIIMYITLHISIVYFFHSSSHKMFLYEYQLWDTYADSLMPINFHQNLHID